MNTIARVVVTLVMAGAVLAPHTLSGASPLTRRSPDASDFQKHLPTLAPDVPWLMAYRRASSTGVLPEAGSIKGLMLAPRPAQGWGALTSYPATLRSSTR
jgi:hypothetical protein